MSTKDKIIIAMDFSDQQKAKAMIDLLAAHVGYFKFGLEAITSPDVNTPKVIDYVHQVGGKVFYDGKFDDIPNTVKAAVKNVVGMGVDMFNVHASCGMKAMQEAAYEKGNAIALAVSVLTSIAEDNAHLIFGKPSKATVLQFARMARLAGMDGMISSPKELPILTANQELEDLFLVTPGIRPEWAKTNDQQRITTPRKAVIGGADYLVIGRPITGHKDPVEAVQKIIEEIDAPFEPEK